MPVNDYVLLVCDDAANSAAAAGIVNTLSTAIRIEILNDPELLLKRVEKSAPLFILIFLSKDNSTYTRYLKDLRQQLVSDNIPVFIYHTLPDEAEINSLLKRYIKADKKE